MAHDELLAALVRAIACELFQLGYRPCATPGQIQQVGKKHVKLVAQETWQAIREITSVSERNAPEEARLPRVKMPFL